MLCQVGNHVHHTAHLRGNAILAAAATPLRFVGSGIRYNWCWLDVRMTDVVSDVWTSIAHCSRPTAYHLERDLRHKKAIVGRMA